MTTWVDITNAEVAAGAPITTALMTSLRDNIEGIAQRATGAPKIFGVPYDYQEFTASGTWTKPSNAESGDKVVVQVVGGGASGVRDTSTNDPVGGGGGGGIIMNIDDIDDLAATEPVTVGAGGAAVAGTSPNDGGSSAFGTDAVKRPYIVATGGGAGTGHQSGGEAFARFRGGQAEVTDDKGLYVDDAGGEVLNVTRGGAASADNRTSSSVYGGGAGGINDALERGSTGGFSLYAGYGGETTSNDAGDSVTDFLIDGGFPGGGGGAVMTQLSDDTVSGAGGDGVVRVWCIKEG